MAFAQRDASCLVGGDAGPETIARFKEGGPQNSGCDSGLPEGWPAFGETGIGGNRAVACRRLESSTRARPSPLATPAPRPMLRSRRDKRARHDAQRSKQGRSTHARKTGG